MKKQSSVRTTFLLILLLIMGTAACSEAPTLAVDPDLAEVRFSGDRALAIETQFVTNFPDRDSGQPNNRRAADWLAGQFSGSA